MEALTTLVKFINYWWFRWTLVTEMYMVEKWERITINCIFIILFLAFWYFNYKVILSFTQSFMDLIFEPSSSQAKSGSGNNINIY